MREAAKVAAKWWADQLRAPEQKRDNGDAFQSAFLEVSIKNLKHKMPTEPQIDKFEAILAARVDREISDN